MTRILITGGSGFIGTNWMAHLLASRHDVRNVDICPPLCAIHHPYWIQGDIMDVSRLKSLFNSFGPEWLIHLAARTDCDEHTTVEKGYAANTVGTENVASAIKSCPSIKRAIITSSQYVCRPGYSPRHDEDYAPHTVYGHSKVQTEIITRNANLPCTWTIVRPTNIWGPWHLRYRREFWRIVQKGMYFHPSGAPVIRSYGYVENIIWQCMRMLEAERPLVDKRVFYVGDRPADIYEWATAFSKELANQPARKVQRWLFRGLGFAGDVINYAGMSFPFSSSRYTSMTSNYIAPIDKTFELLGTPPFSLTEGVKRTAQWLKDINNDADISRL